MPVERGGCPQPKRVEPRRPFQGPKAKNVALIAQIPPGATLSTEAVNVCEPGTSEAKGLQMKGGVRLPGHQFARGATTEP